jgi:hypothetical protein
MGEKRNVYRLLVGKPEGKKPVGRRRRRWVDIIKIGIVGRENFKEISERTDSGWQVPQPTLDQEPPSDSDILAH